MKRISDDMVTDGNEISFYLSPLMRYFTEILLKNLLRYFERKRKEVNIEVIIIVSISLFLRVRNCTDKSNE